MPPQSIFFEIKPCELNTPAGNIEYILCRSTRRRSIALSISAKGEVRLHAPRFISEGDARGFVLAKSSWIIRKLKEVQQEQCFLADRTYADGQEFLFLGKTFSLRVIKTSLHKPKIHFDGQSWLVHVSETVSRQVEESVVKKLLVHWYREQAREVFPGRIFNYGRIMGLDPREIAVKTQRRSWGSCSYHRRSINLNWQLVMAPMGVIDYVVVHELSHLVHPNHSVRFWRKVAKFMPNYKERRTWLRAHRLELILP